MGKKGELLRAMKKQQARYSFTGAELEEHDRQVRQAYREDLRARMHDAAKDAAAMYEEQTKARIQEHWDNIEKEFYTSDERENTMNMLQYLLCVSSRVLIERFRWKPVPKDGNYDRRNRTVQFAEAVVEEIGKIGGDEGMDIRTYSEETFNLYGVKFTRGGDMIVVIAAAAGFVFGFCSGALIGLVAGMETLDRELEE